MMNTIQHFDLMSHGRYWDVHAFENSGNYIVVYVIWTDRMLAKDFSHPFT